MKKRIPKYSNEAIKLNDDTYFYECGRGLDFVVYHPSQGQPMRFIMPWKMIEASVKTRRAVVAHRNSKK